MRKKLAVISLLIGIYGFSQKQGGMWLPHLLEQINEPEMRSLGMQMSLNDIYNINSSSIKDAIVHFNGECSASIISP